MSFRKQVLSWLAVFMLGTSVTVSGFPALAYASQGTTETETQSLEIETESVGEAEYTGKDSVTADGTIKTAQFELQVNYGFEGRYRLGAAIPVSVEITSRNADFSGIVRIVVPGNTQYSAAPVAYEKSVSLKKGTAKTVTLSIYDTSYASSMGVQVEDEGGKLAVDQTIQINSNTGTEALVGILSDNPENLSYLNRCNLTAGAYTGSSSTVVLHQSSMPEQASGLEALSFLVMDQYSSSQLNEQQYKAIKEWVSTGGVLIIGTGIDGARTLSAFEDSLLPFSQGKQIKGELALVGTGKYVDVVNQNEEEELVDIPGDEEPDDMDADDDEDADENSDDEADADTDDVNEEANADADEDAASEEEGSGLGGDMDPVSADGDVIDEGPDGPSYMTIDTTPYAFSKRSGVYEISVTDAQPMENVLTDSSLILQKSYGEGKVIVTAFSLGSTLINEWSGNKAFATILMSEAADGYSAERITSLNYSNIVDHNEEEKTLYRMMDIGTPDMQKLMIILGAFVIGIGLVLYLFLRIIDLRGLLWILVPICAIGCTVGILYVTSEVRISRPMTVSLTTICKDEVTGRTSADVGMLTMIPDTKKNEIKLNPLFSGLQVFDSTEEGISLIEDTENYQYTTAVRETKDGYQLILDHDGTFETTFFYMNQKEAPETEGLVLEVERSLDGLSGTIENKSGYDMKCVSIYARGIAVSIGNLKNGDKEEFTLAENRVLDGEFLQLNMPGIEYGTTEYDQMERIWNLFYDRNLSVMEAGDVYTYGYIPNMGTTYISESKVDETNVGIMISNYSMGYKEYDNKLPYDLYDYMEDIEDTFTGSERYLFTEETECTFNLPTTEVTALIRTDIAYADGDSSDTEVYAYNGQTGTYEVLFAKEDVETFKKGCPYVAEDGTVLLKYSCTDPYKDCAPDITFLGGDD